MAGHGLRMGHGVEQTAFVEDVQKKGFEKGTPMVLVNQKIVYRHMPQEGGGGIGDEIMSEKRTHAFLPHDMHANKRAIKDGVLSNYPNIPGVLTFPSAL